MRALRIIGASAFLAGICAAIALAAHPSHPTSRDQALADGCQRSDIGIFFDKTPEWVYVDRSPAIRKAKGIVRIPHASLGDSIQQHRSFDFNANLVPDAPYRYLVAGSPSTHTNNYAPGGGEEFGRLHFEWESLTFPRWAWPTDEDRATLWGSWIWDCGHWQSGSENNTGNQVTGEHSELHPLNGIAVQRHAPYLPGRRESETDVFISNMGNAAHAIEQCALTHHPVSSTSYPQYDSGFQACALDAANQIQPLASSYRFYVPAPPKPSSRAHLRYRVADRLAHGMGSEHVVLKPHGIEVTVAVPSSSSVERYGKSFFVYWSEPSGDPPSTLKVTLNSLHIKQADPNPALADPSGAHWVLYLDLNGYWQLLNKWAPKLPTHVTNRERIAVNHSVVVHVPQGAPVWFQVMGLECDEVAGKQTPFFYAHLLYPCPANTDEQNSNAFDVFNNDDTGMILNVYRSAAAATGHHTSTSAAFGHYPGIGAVTLGDGKQGQGDYQLSYTITTPRHKRG